MMTFTFCTRQHALNWPIPDLPRYWFQRLIIVIIIIGRAIWTQHCLHILLNRFFCMCFLDRNTNSIKCCTYIFPTYHIPHITGLVWQNNGGSPPASFPVFFTNEGYTKKTFLLLLCGRPIVALHFFVGVVFWLLMVAWVFGCWTGLVDFLGST